jgi:hypothetical protein
MAHVPDRIKWCTTCYSEGSGPGGRCPACSPPLPRCANCGALVWETACCGPACELELAAEFAAADLRYTEALASQADTAAIDAEAIAEKTAWQKGWDF